MYACICVCVFMLVRLNMPFRGAKRTRKDQSISQIERPLSRTQCRGRRFAERQMKTYRSRHIGL